MDKTSPPAAGQRAGAAAPAEAVAGSGPDDSPHPAPRRWQSRRRLGSAAMDVARARGGGVIELEIFSFEFGRRAGARWQGGGRAAAGRWQGGDRAILQSGLDQGDTTQAVIGHGHPAPGAPDAGHVKAGPRRPPVWRRAGGRGRRAPCARERDATRRWARSSRHAPPRADGRGSLARSGPGPAGFANSLRRREGQRASSSPPRGRVAIAALNAACSACPRAGIKGVRKGRGERSEAPRKDHGGIARVPKSNERMAKAKGLLRGPSRRHRWPARDRRIRPARHATGRAELSTGPTGQPGPGRHRLARGPPLDLLAAPPPAWRRLRLLPSQSGCGGIEGAAHDAEGLTQRGASRAGKIAERPPCSRPEGRSPSMERTEPPATGAPAGSTGSLDDFWIFLGGQPGRSGGLGVWI